MLITKIKSENEYVNIDYECPNSHYGSLDIILFISKFPSFSSFYCVNCKKKKSSKIKEKLYFCKDCQEILCQKHIKECRINNEYIVIKCQNTFDEYLNDDNDKIFVKSLLQIPYFNSFIQKQRTQGLSIS